MDMGTLGYIVITNKYKNVFSTRVEETYDAALTDLKRIEEEYELVRGRLRIVEVIDYDDAD